ncbi:hypothetical protein I4U23_021755, partial [Adineta vaga]
SHWCLIQKCFLVKHTDGKTNELINWNHSDQGLGTITVEYENTDIQMFCTFERRKNGLWIGLITQNRADDVLFEKEQYIDENNKLKLDNIGSLVLRMTQFIQNCYDGELALQDKKK